MFSSDDNHERRSHSNRADGQQRGLRHRIPYRLLGRRSMGTKRLLVSSKVLLSAIPTHNCDVVLTFPAKTEDSTLMWLLARLKSRTPALTVHVRHHSNSGIYGFYLTAAYDSLLQGAEELGISKPLKTEYGGGMKEFVFEDQDCFADVDNEAKFLSSQERQNIVLHFLNELRATGDDALEGIKFVESQPIVPMLLTKNVMAQVFPLHKSEDLKTLRHGWVQAIFSTQPLDLVCRYFGVKIALYFAYLGHYTTWLFLPALIGLFIFLFQGGDQFLEDICFLGFALFNVIWATLYLKFWHRSSALFAYRWGTLEKKDDLLKDPRPLFKGYLVKSPVTGHLELYYPPWKRILFRYLVTLPIISLCLGFVFVTMLLCFELQELVNDLIASSDLPYVFSFGPKILLAIVVSILDEVYKEIAMWLTHKENYRLEESFETNLVIKLVLFQFVNSYLSLFYIGFYLGDMDRLRDQLGALLITRQVIGNLKEALLPYFIWKARLYSVGYRIATRMSPASVEKEVRKMTHSGPKKAGGTSKDGRKGAKGGERSDDAKAKVSDDNDDSAQTEEEEEGVPSLTQAEVESAMKKYEDTLEDYLEMSIQFGYITLFSSAFPLAALCAFVNNIIEIRSDAFKLCLTHQRPFGKRVEDFGIWRDILEVLSALAVIVNCILIGTTGVLDRLCPSLDSTISILSLVTIEHIFLFLIYCIQQAIPDTPPTICTELAKLECQRSEALKQLESQHSMASSLHPVPGTLNTGLRRRNISDAVNKESSPSSTPDAFRQTVITPTSPPERPCDIPLLSYHAMGHPGLPASNAQKPEVPPRTSLMANKETSKSADYIAEKIVSAAMNPTVESVESQETECKPETPKATPSPRSVTKTKTCIRPVTADSQEKDFQSKFRQRLLLGERRGRSEPVYDAVSAALRLHRDKERDTDVGKGDSENDVNNVVNISNVRLQNKQSIQRGNLRESRLERLRMEGRGEMRRASSLKHVRRRERDSGDWIKDVGKPLSPRPSPDPGPSPRLPPPAPPSSPRPGVGADSPTISRSARLRGELSSLANRVLSRKARSLSSTDLNNPASQLLPKSSWKDRHSWKAEMAVPGTPGCEPKPVSSSSKDCDDPQQEASSVVAPHSDHVDSEGREGEKKVVPQNIGLTQDRSPRAQRAKPGQPLSFS